MGQNSLKYLIESDLKRYGISGSFGLLFFIKNYWFRSVPGVRFSLVFRCCQHFRYRNRPLFYIFYRWWRIIKYKYGFDISYRTQIGPGLYIGHFGQIVIHGDTKIGSNCNLSQGITIGILNRGKYQGIPEIGNRVFIGPNAVVLGGISIGDDVLIGANSLVSEPIPSNSTVIVSGSQIIENKGSDGYIHNII